MPIIAASVHVCGLRHLPDVVERTGARHLVSAINGDVFPKTPAGIARNNHLKLDMHDITKRAFDNPRQWPHWPLARDKVRHVGEPVVAVVAETLEQARDAADLVEELLGAASRGVGEFAQERGDDFLCESHEPSGCGGDIGGAAEKDRANAVIRKLGAPEAKVEAYTTLTVALDSSPASKHAAESNPALK